MVPDVSRERDAWPAVRAAVVRDAVGIGVATGAYALSFGALSTAAGFSVAQTCVLSLAMFTGASQFALAGVVGTGGAASAGVATAVLLGTRNALYGVRLAPLLRVRGVRRFAAAHLVIDESTAMATARDEPPAGRLGFWATGLAVFVCWNTGTVIGAAGASVLADPRSLGLDAAAPAAFLALVWPRLLRREPATVAALAMLTALVSTPFVPVGVPVLLAALVAVAAGLRPQAEAR
jgi:predicted branched-subunit amino acid permease